MLMRGKGFVVLALVTAAVVVGAMYVIQRDPAQAPEVGSLLFPGLLARINDVSQVDVRTGSEPFRLERKDRGWVAPARGDYPLDGNKVHKLLVGAAGLERLEPKTDDPARFGELGLRDPGEPDARSTEFSIRAGDALLAQLIVGEQRPAKGDPNRTEYFLRVPGEQRSWLVRGTLPDRADELVDWLQQDVAAISDSRIARVQVHHPDGATLTAVRDAPGGGDFRYAELADGAKMSGAWMINDIGRVLTDLKLEEVQPAAQAGAPAADAVEAVTETFDGLRVRLRAWRDGERTLATLRAEFDEALVVRQSADAEPSAGLLSAAEVREEAQALDARWQPWVYELPDYKGDYLHRRQNDLVEAPEPAPAAAPDKGGTAPPAPAAPQDAKPAS
jgi:hypothetical protein